MSAEQTAIGLNLPRCQVQPFEYGASGTRTLQPPVPVRFDDGTVVVTVGGTDHLLDHPVGAVLSKIVRGEQFTAAEMQGKFWELGLFDFVNIFAGTENVLGALEVGCPPQKLMAAKLNGMAMASRFKDAGQRERFVRNFCLAIGRCGFVPEAAQ